MEGISFGGVCFICRTTNFGLSKPTPTTWFHNQCSPSSVLSEHLNVYFLLRHVLELPSEHLEKYLRCCPSPENWVKICQDCSANYVEKCAKAFVELLEVKRRFDGIRLGLIDEIKRRSLDVEEKLLEEEIGKGNWIEPVVMLDISLETRRFVIQNDYSRPPQVNPFTGGDLLARSKCVAKKIQNEIPISSSITFPGLESDSITFTEFTIPEDEAIDTHDIKEEPESPLPDAVHDTTFTTSSSEDDSDDQTSGDDWNPDNHLSASSDEEIEETNEDKVAVPNRETKRLNVTTQKIQKKYKDQRTQSQFKCDLCPGTFQTTKGLRKHQVIKHNTNHYECSKCGWKSNSAKKDSIRMHMKRYHGTEKDLKDLTCSKCGKIFSFKSSLHAHHQACNNENRKKFVCEHCGREFCRRLSYFHHLGIAHGITDNLKFKCSFEGCNKAYFTKGLLIIHEAGHKPPEYECHICGVTFPLKGTLNRHMAQHQGKRSHLCDHCPASYARRDNLLKHMRTAHSQDKSSEDKPSIKSRQRCHYKCSECELIFGWRSQLKGHQEKVHGGSGIVIVVKSANDSGKPENKVRRFRCDQCSKMFSDSHGLHIHEVKAHKLFQCRKCEWKGEDLPSLQNHEKECNGTKCHGMEMEFIKEPEKFSCDLCDKIYNARVSLWRHKSQAHQGSKEPEKECEICGMVYANQGSLLDHMKRVHGPKRLEKLERKVRKKITCNQCNLKFPMRNSLQRHMETVHGVIVKKEPKSLHSFPCSICGQDFSKKMDRLRHTNSMHRKKSGFCDLCGRNTGSSTLLKRHKAQVHKIGVADTPRFQCTVEGCTRQFWNECQMKSHVLRIHEGQRSFQCEQCGKNLVSATYLNRHIQVMHSANREDKPFKCEECGKGFAINDYLWLHKQTHKKKASAGDQD